MLFHILISSVITYFIWRILSDIFKPSVISSLRGPTRSSYIAGNFKELFRSREITDAHLDWGLKYGTAFKIYGELGIEMLFISDPKAMQYILNTSGYDFPKPLSNRIVASIILGPGIVAAEGTQHARQRKLLNPAFSFNSLKGFLPLFRAKASELVAKLKEEVYSAEPKSLSKVVNLVPWLSRTTLDIIGTASADFDFEALKGVQNNKLAQAYNNLFADALYQLGDVEIVMPYLFSKLPSFLTSGLQRLPIRSLARFRNYMTVAREVAQEVVDKQTQLYLSGKEGSKDIMSLLVRANLSEDPKTKLEKDELLAQLTTFFLAGHETSSSALTWIVYELSKHPEWQAKLREEITITRSQASERGDDSELTIADLDSMIHLQAVIKETLRLYPIVASVIREAGGKRDVIPLSSPIQTQNGETITDIPINRGERVYISFVAYNRLKSVWGEDADEWRPERFLKKGEGAMPSQVSLGLIGNIASFSSGIRGCIGWRFSVLEMQTVLIELLENFELSPPPGDVRILRVSVGGMGPMVEGSKSGRTEMPLTLTPLS